jgi:hypothetical protein
MRRSACLCNVSAERSVGVGHPLRVEFLFAFATVHDFTALSAYPVNSAVIIKSKGETGTHRESSIGPVTQSRWKVCRDLEHFAAYPVPPVELLAAFHPSLPLDLD